MGKLVFLKPFPQCYWAFQQKLFFWTFWVHHDCQTIQSQTDNAILISSRCTFAFPTDFSSAKFFSVHRTMFLCFLRKKVIQTDIDGNFHKRNYVQKGFCFFCWIKDRYNYHCLLFVHHIGTCLQYSIGKNICRPIFVYCLLSVGGCRWQKSRPLLFVFLFSRP